MTRAEQLKQVQQIESINTERIDKEVKKSDNVFKTLKVGDIVKRFEDGKLLYNFRLALYLTSKDYIHFISGIDWRILNKYDSEYYEFLNKEDTEKLLKAVNQIILPEHLHKELKDYPNIKYIDYAPQDAERQEQKRAYSQKIKEKVQDMREMMGLC